ncbi:MAG: 2-amino-4-hydroxy-6-hydroxymethyldihydropteridine diphosphokinase [bacterium]
MMIGKMSGIFLSLGSNLGNRRNNLYYVINEIKKHRLITVEKVSSFYNTSPLGEKKQPDFINAVIQIKTRLTPDALLFFIKSLEKKIGREKIKKWGARIADIDIIFYNDLVVKKHGLIIPHPEVKNRLFVLNPLIEIAKDLAYPGEGIKIADLIKKLKK